MTSIERATTNMINNALGHTHKASTSTTQAPAEINLFHVGKEARIQSAYFVPISTAHHQGSSSSPKDGGYIIILSIIFLDISKKTAAAERVTIFIDKTTRGTSIFKTIALTFGQQFRLTSGHFRMLIHIVQQRLQPIRRDFHV